MICKGLIFGWWFFNLFKFEVLSSRSSGVARNTRSLLIRIYVFNSNLRFWRVTLFILFFSSRPSGGGPTCQLLFFACAKKSNQKKAHNLTKIDPDITYSLWDGFIQYTLAAPTKTFFTRHIFSSISELASSQYHSDSADFSKHNEATTNKFSSFFLF
jgi:hypothetical protein